MVCDMNQVAIKPRHGGAPRGEGAAAAGCGRPCFCGGRWGLVGAVAAGLLALVGCGDGLERGEPTPPGKPCVPQVSGAVGPGSQVSFDADHILCVRLTMKSDDFERLRAENRFGVHETVLLEETFAYLTDGCAENVPRLYNWYEADVDADGLALQRVGIRRKGFLGSVIGQGWYKPSLKIKTDLHVPGQLLGDTEHITLNNNLQDPRRMQSCLAYGIFADAGYPAPRCNLANVMVNGVPMGTYSHVEAIKKRFLARAFGDSSGSLYEGTLADFSSAFLGGAEGGNLGRWQAKTGDTDPTGLPLRKLRDALLLPDDQLLQGLAPLLDVERFVTFWALEALLNHGDGYTAGRNNFYVYFDPGDGGRAVFIPWGPDNVMNGDGDEASLDRHVYGEVARRLSRLPAVAPQFESEMRRLLHEAWREEVLLARIDSYAEQVQGAETDPGFQASVADLRAWVTGRRSTVAALLNKGLPAGRASAGQCTDLPFDIPGGGADALSILAFLW